MQIIETSLPGVLLIQPRVFSDPRGFFMETYRQNTLAEAGIKEIFVQDNHSRSSRGVLRGLHYQLRARRPNCAALPAARFWISPWMFDTVRLTSADG